MPVDHTQFYFGIFLNRYKKTFASGVTVYQRGIGKNGRHVDLRHGVIIRRIPRNAPQDWEMGPRQTFGEWGAYTYTHFWDSPRWKHYAFATGETPEKCQQAAAGHFQFQVGPWSKCENVRSLEASVRYRYHEGSN